MAGRDRAVIIRVFRGRVQPGSSERYLRYLYDHGLPEFRRHPGMLGLHLGTPLPGAPEEFMVTSVWQSLADLVAFTGGRWREARIMPGEEEFLQDKSVHHYEAAPTEVPGALRDTSPRSSVVEAGPVRVDATRRLAFVDGEAVDLPPRELAVLAELAARAGEPVPSAELAFLVWPDLGYVTAEDVRRVVYRLRRRIGDAGRTPPLIRHRRGYGYFLDPSGGG